LKASACILQAFQQHSLKRPYHRYLVNERNRSGYESSGSHVQSEAGFGDWRAQACGIQQAFHRCKRD
jgi:hypothetical protein